MKMNLYLLWAPSLVCTIMACAGAPGTAKDGVFVPTGNLRKVTLPEPTSKKLPAWHGFNKLNLFLIGSGESYDDGGMDIRESDFALIRQMGFNFVRFPIDYRYIYNPADKSFNMDKIAWIDHAINYGIKYNVHVNLNIHSAPGYSVVGFDDGFKLVTTGREHFIEIWKFLAKRYKNIPNSVLSFNLLNEPDANMVFDQTGLVYAPEFASLMSETITAIREYRPDRLIVMDSVQRNAQNLSQLGIPTDNIILSNRGYAPWSVTNDGMMGQSQSPANFTDPQITWPIKNYFNGFIYAPWHSTHLFGVQNTRAVFNNPEGFAAGTASMLMAAQYLEKDELALICDGVETARCVSVKSPDGKPWTAAFPKNSIPAGTKKVEIIDAVGDTVNVDVYTISGVTVKCTNIDWGYAPSEMTVGVDTESDAQDLRNWIMPSPAWDGLPVMIGEMGCMAPTPEKAVFRARLMGDYVDAFHDMPWAFWEFKGGAMSMFNLNQTDVCTAPVDVKYGDGQTQRYYYDKLWYDAIKHALDKPWNN